jgi:type I restriction enzyme M protein
VAVTSPRRLTTPSSVNAAIKQIADVMRRANDAGALQYVPELSWILFLLRAGRHRGLRPASGRAAGGARVESSQRRA